MCAIASGKTIFTFTVITLAGLRAVVFARNFYGFRLPGDSIMAGFRLPRPFRREGRGYAEERNFLRKSCGTERTESAQKEEQLVPIYKLRCKFFIFASEEAAVNASECEYKWRYHNNTASIGTYYIHCGESLRGKATKNGKPSKIAQQIL